MVIIRRVLNSLISVPAQTLDLDTVLNLWQQKSAELEGPLNWLLLGLNFWSAIAMKVKFIFYDILESFVKV